MQRIAHATIPAILGLLLTAGGTEAEAPKYKTYYGPKVSLPNLSASYDGPPAPVACQDNRLTDTEDDNFSQSLKTYVEGSITENSISAGLVAASQQNEPPEDQSTGDNNWTSTLEKWAKKIGDEVLKHNTHTNKANCAIICVALPANANNDRLGGTIGKSQYVRAALDYHSKADPGNEAGSGCWNCEPDPWFHMSNREAFVPTANNGAMLYCRMVANWSHTNPHSVQLTVRYFLK